MKKSIIGLAISCGLILLCVIVPAPTELGQAGLLSMGIFAAAIVMWISEAPPMSVTGLGLSMLMVLFEVYTIQEAYRTFAGTAFFFVFATYAINACLAETSIPDRICAFFINITKQNTKLFVFGIMISAAMLSAIMSNMATCALLATLSLKLLKLNGNPQPGTSRLAKCLFIGIPLACGAGGFATPAGTPANIIAISLLEEHMGITITFLGWMLAGIPMALISVMIGAFSVTSIFPPEPLSDTTITYAVSLKKELGTMTLKEKKVLGIIGTEIVLWILSTWIPQLNTTLVAILAMAVMFMPGIQVLDWKTYDRYANYDCLFMMGSITALVGGLSTSGATRWLVECLVPDMSTWAPISIFLTASLMVAVCHMAIPAGSAVLSLAAVPLIGIALATGTDGTALLMIAAFWSGAAFLLPFDGVPLLTYGYGYYKMTDMAKTGILPYVILIPLTAVLIPFLVVLLGI